MDSRRSGIEEKIDGRIEMTCFWVVAFFEQVAPSLSHRKPNSVIRINSVEVCTEVDGQVAGRRLNM